MRRFASGAVGSDSRAGGVIHADVVVGAAEEVVTALTGLLARFHAALSRGRSGSGAGATTGGHGVHGALRSTDSGGVVDDLDLHVTLITPGGSPRVSHDPVLNSVLGSVSDHTDGVIKCSSASRRVHDTSLVGLESAVVSLNEDGDGLLVEGSFDGGGGVGSNLLVGGGLDTGSTTVVSARSVLADVGVRGLGHGEVLLVVLERGGLHTSIASIVRLGAIDELLLSEGEEASGRDEVSSLHGHVGGERPARTALTLVLDGVHGTLGSPVDTTGGGRARAGSSAVVARFLAAGKHVGGVSGAPAITGPRGAV